MTERFSSDWLALREPADAAARAVELVDDVRGMLPAGDRVVIRDLGCGTGSMGRWLAPRLPGPQEWVLHDHDPALLDHAAGALPAVAADGTAVTVRTRVGDITALGAEELAGTTLVTCSALLDLLTADEVEALAAACAAARTAALCTLSVAGAVTLRPDDPADRQVAAAFNAHQRRRVDGRRLLGPDAPRVAADAFAARGATVRTAASPWRLDADHADLTVQWLHGWVSAAAESRPDLDLDDYRRRREQAAAAGTLAVTVGHVDLLARFG